MDTLAIIYLGLLLITNVIAATIGVVAWRRRPIQGTTTLAAFMSGIVIWTGFVIGNVLVQDPELSLAMSKLKYVGIVIVPASLFALVLEYTGRSEWIDRRLVAALAIEPLVVLGAFLFAPESMYAAVELGSGPTGVDVSHGSLFWIHALYSYLLLAAGTVLLLAFLYRSSYLLSQQVISLVVATVAPWVGNVVYLSGIVSVDITPVAFSISGGALGWSILRAQFIDLEPVARDTVVDQLNHGAFVVDQKGRLTDINKAGREMLGAEGAVIGRPFSEFFEEYPVLIDEFADASEKRETVVLDTPAGRQAYDVEVTELTDYRGRSQGRLFLTQDVTDQRRRQRELERQNEHLERFASVVSHGLRNPLNVLEGYVGRAQRLDSTEPLTKAEASIERMNRLIDDVLSLAREGRQIESTEPVELRSVAEDAWSQVDAHAATMRVVDDSTVRADRSRLQQALENLFRNAVDHVGPDVTVEVGPLTDGTGFYVQDDGPGIPPEKRDEVFEYGYTTAQEGTGLGLSIVEAIAEAHGWEVALGDGSTDTSSAESGASEPSVGARFEFRAVSVARSESSVARTESVLKLEGGA